MLHRHVAQSTDAFTARAAPQSGSRRRAKPSVRTPVPMPPCLSSGEFVQHGIYRTSLSSLSYRLAAIQSISRARTCALAHYVCVRAHVCPPPLLLRFISALGTLQPGPVLVNTQDFSGGARGEAPSSPPLFVGEPSSPPLFGSNDHHPNNWSSAARSCAAFDPYHTITMPL